MRDYKENSIFIFLISNQLLDYWLNKVAINKPLTSVTHGVLIVEKLNSSSRITNNTLIRDYF